MKKLVWDKAKCFCNKGGSKLSLAPSCSLFSSKDGNVLLANSLPVGTFGICQILTQQTGNPTPCVPAFTVWQNLSDNINVLGIKPLTQDSQILCSIGGKITLIEVRSDVEVK